MTRNLTAAETEVLGDVVEDPASWWAHVQSVFDEPRAEAALASKIKRWRPQYEAAKANLGDKYKNRTEREVAAVLAEEARLLAKRGLGIPE